MSSGNGYAPCQRPARLGTRAATRCRCQCQWAGLMVLLLCLLAAPCWANLAIDRHRATLPALDLSHLREQQAMAAARERRRGNLGVDKRLSEAGSRGAVLGELGVPVTGRQGAIPTGDLGPSVRTANGRSATQPEAGSASPRLLQTLPATCPAVVQTQLLCSGNATHPGPGFSPVNSTNVSPGWCRSQNP